MAYGLMTDFLYEVGDGVGEFLTEEEKANFIPLILEDIVHSYSEERNLLNVLLLKRQIRHSIASHLSTDGLVYAHPPFGQETSFIEDYFEGDLHTFLMNVLRLLDKAPQTRSCRTLSALFKR